MLVATPKAPDWLPLAKGTHPKTQESQHVFLSFSWFPFSLVLNISMCLPFLMLQSLLIEIKCANFTVSDGENTQLLTNLKKKNKGESPKVHPEIHMYYIYIESSNYIYIYKYVYIYTHLFIYFYIRSKTWKKHVFPGFIPKITARKIPSATWLPPSSAMPWTWPPTAELRRSSAVRGCRRSWRSWGRCSHRVTWSATAARGFPKGSVGS